MSFLSKLFRRNKSKEETRRIESEVEKIVEEPTEASTEEPTKVEIPEAERVTPERAMAAWVLDLSEKGKFAKDYQLVHNFLVYTNAKEKGLKGLVGGLEGLQPEEITEEMKLFIKQYRFRKLKCSDQDFQDWILNVEI